MEKEIIKFDWNLFCKHLRKLIILHSNYSIIPINSDRWEELIYEVLDYMGKNPTWIQGSHSPGADIIIKEMSLSAKAGKIKDHNLIISSYRLTRFEKLNEMIDFVDGKGKNFDFYLCCARNDIEDKRKYSVFLIDSNIIKAKNMKWVESFSKKNAKYQSGWIAKEESGIQLDIIKKMSNQLWITIPVKFCKEILNVEIENKQLGSKLKDCLNSI